MPPLPVISGYEALRVLESFGFVQRRCKGSHVTLVHSGGSYRNVVVPLHRELKPGMLRGIIRDAGLSVDEFVARLRD